MESEPSLLGWADEGVCPYAYVITSVLCFREKKCGNSYCVASNLPYSLCCELTSPKCLGIAVHPGAAQFKGRGGESESLEEEAIEIGNS